MLSDFFHFWHTLPLAVQLLGDFWFTVIFLRGVVAKDITSWLEDRGFISEGKRSIVYRMLDFVYNHAKRLVNWQPSARTLELWEQHGNQTRSV